MNFDLEQWIDSTWRLKMSGSVSKIACAVACAVVFFLFFG
jgi:hypothetical protein